MSAEQLFDYHVHIDGETYSLVGDNHFPAGPGSCLTIYRADEEVFQANGTLSWCRYPKEPAETAPTEAPGYPCAPAEPDATIETTHGSIRVGSRVKHLPSGNFGEVTELYPMSNQIRLRYSDSTEQMVAVQNVVLRVPPEEGTVDDDEADAKIASLHPDIPSPILGLTRPGDLVRQRTGGPAMTVSGAYGTSVSCEWAGEKSIETGRFELSDLVPASAIDEDGNPVEPPEPMIAR